MSERDWFILAACVAAAILLIALVALMMLASDDAEEARRVAQAGQEVAQVGRDRRRPGTQPEERALLQQVFDYSRALLLRCTSGRRGWWPFSHRHDRIVVQVPPGTQVQVNVQPNVPVDDQQVASQQGEQQ